MKKIIAMLLCMALCATMAITGTVAYLTDEEDAKNIFEVGNVDIEQYEKDRDGEEFEQKQHLFPKVQVENGDALSETVTKDINGEVNLVNTERYNNYIDKIVTVENKGKSEAYVRNIVAVPTGLPAGVDAPWLEVTFLDAANSDNDDWKQCPVVEDVEIDGILYDLYVFNYEGPVDGKLASGDLTMPTLLGFSMSSLVNFDEKYVNADGTLGAYYYPGEDGDVYLTITPDANSILVATQAVQVEGFADFEHAFRESFNGDISKTNHPWYEADSSNQGSTNYVAKLSSGATIANWADLGNLVTVDANGTLTAVDSSITELTISSENVNSIQLGNNAQKTGLRKLSIGDGVTLKGNAFANSPELEEVYLSGKVSFAYYSHFFACYKLHTVEIGEGVTAVPESCFQSCTSLSNVTLPSTLQTIEKKAFKGCTALTSIDLPDSFQNLTVEQKETIFGEGTTITIT